MADGIVYDSVDWHLGGDFPDDLDDAAARTHIGVFLAWIVERGLLAEDVARDNADEVAAVRAGELSGSDFLRDCCDDVLSADVLSEEGDAFARDYYEALYLDDYVDLSDDDLPTIYHEPDSPEKRAEVRAVLDERFAEWQRDGAAAFG